MRSAPSRTTQTSLTNLKHINNQASILHPWSSLSSNMHEKLAWETQGKPSYFIQRPHRQWGGTKDSEIDNWDLWRPSDDEKLQTEVIWAHFEIIKTYKNGCVGNSTGRKRQTKEETGAHIQSRLTSFNSSQRKAKNQESWQEMVILSGSSRAS